MITAAAQPVLAFSARTSPSAAELGAAIERGARTPRAVLRLRFGADATALAIRDLWSACCELLLAAQLVREGKLDRFVLDAEQVFDIHHRGQVMLCVFSTEHVFPVLAKDFAGELERLVGEIFAGTTCPRVMHIAAKWGADEIRGLPYSLRFSDSPLI